MSRLTGGAPTVTATDIVIMAATDMLIYRLAIFRWVDMGISISLGTAMGSTVMGLVHWVGIGPVPVVSSKSSPGRRTG